MTKKVLSIIKQIWCRMTCHQIIVNRVDRLSHTLFRCDDGINSLQFGQHLIKHRQASIDTIVSFKNTLPRYHLKIITTTFVPICADHTSGEQIYQTLPNLSNFYTKLYWNGQNILILVNLIYFAVSIYIQ